ncbi:hypothetical protein PAMP_010723 [Pampus punctatissimus]
MTAGLSAQSSSTPHSLKAARLRLVGQNVKRGNVKELFHRETNRMTEAKHLSLHHVLARSNPDVNPSKLSSQTEPVIRPSHEGVPHSIGICAFPLRQALADTVTHIKQVMEFQHAHPRIDRPSGVQQKHRTEIELLFQSELAVIFRQIDYSLLGQQGIRVGQNTGPLDSTTLAHHYQSTTTLMEELNRLLLDVEAASSGCEDTLTGVDDTRLWLQTGMLRDSQ